MVAINTFRTISDESIRENVFGELANNCVFVTEAAEVIEFVEKKAYGVILNGRACDLNGHTVKDTKREITIEEAEVLAVAETEMLPTVRITVEPEPAEGTDPFEAFSAFFDNARDNFFSAADRKLARWESIDKLFVGDEQRARDGIAQAKNLLDAVVPNPDYLLAAELRLTQAQNDCRDAKYAGRPIIEWTNKITAYYDLCVRCQKMEVAEPVLDKVMKGHFRAVADIQKARAAQLKAAQNAHRDAVERFEGECGKTRKQREQALVAAKQTHDNAARDLRIWLTSEDHARMVAYQSAK